jgi:hypothetical protein
MTWRGKGCPKGDGAMKVLRPAVSLSPDEETLQTWEDMRAELLHEIQDGEAMQDEQVEAVSLVVATVHRWPFTQAFALQTVSVSKN